MTKKQIEVEVADGVANGLTFVPDGDGPFPLVVFYMDAGGLRPALDGMAERLTEAGYAVLQPNLYWRAGEFEPFDFNTVWSDPDERTRIFTLMGSFTPEQAMAETRALIEVMSEDERVSTDRIGCVGYCLGGRMSFIAAAALADRVVAIASIHGGHIVTDKPNSPHLGAPQIKARLYFGCADNDTSCTAEHRAILDETLTAAEVDHRIELYEGARHGFAVPDFPVFDQTAADRHWQRVFELFDATLRAA